MEGKGWVRKSWVKVEGGRWRSLSKRYGSSVSASIGMLVIDKS